MPTPEDIQDAGRTLRGGGIVAFPTETVYGLGANALDANAVAKVFAAKGRPSFDPLIVHVARAQDAWALVDLAGFSDRQRALVSDLARAFWPGPLTLVLPRRKAENLESGKAENPDLKKKGTDPVFSSVLDVKKREENGVRPLFFVPGIVTSGLGTVGVRVPGHVVARELIQAAGVPIAAPSANAFGGISPTRAEHVTVPCDMVLDGGPCATGVESTVVGFAELKTEKRKSGKAKNVEGKTSGGGGGVVVLRLGGTSVEAIERVVGGAVVVARPGEKIASPGMLDRHYAPRTRLVVVGRLDEVAPATLGGKAAGLISLRGDLGRGMGFAHVEVLSAQGDLTAAAARLFEAMHRLDGLGLDVIVAEAVPEVGLGRAINDRLRRASSGR